MANGKTIRCLMRFEEVFGAWRVDLSCDGRTLRTLQFADDYKITEMARRGNGLRDSEATNMLEYAHGEKRGAVVLYLSPEQIAELTRRNGAHSSEKNSRDILQTGR